MTFKVTVVNKLSENVLHKGRNGAGVKAELFFIRFDKMFGKHHVSDTKREIVLEKVFRYMTLSLFERANSVSVGFVETENSDSKS